MSSKPDTTAVPPGDSSKIESQRKSRLPVFLSVGVLLAGAAAAYFIMVTAPATEPDEEIRPPKLVQTVEVKPRDVPASVTVDGIVIPSREVTIKPEVEGRLIRYHPSLVPGGYIPEGAELLGIDPETYELALTETEAALEEAKFELDVERGRQVVAEREWEQLKDELKGEDTNQALVLREPHLRRAEALIRKGENAIAQARLDLKRTSINCPFNAMVLDESIEIGQVVDPGNPVATLVGADEFWVQVSVPLEELRHVQLPEGTEPGAKARITLDAGDGSIIEKEGHVLRLLSDLDKSGRMVRMLVSVPDPLNRGGEPPGGLPLLLGSYVMVEIEAGVQEGVLVVDRKALRAGNQIWVVGQDNKLRMRDATVLWKRREDVLIANILQPGELLVVSGLRTATPGMVVNPQSAPDELGSELSPAP